MGNRNSSDTNPYQIHHSEICVGKRHGDTHAFDDATFLPPGYHRVYEVRVWHADLVHAIQFIYIDGTNTIHPGPLHGHSLEQLEHDGAQRDDLTLATNEGEYIVSISGRAGDLIDHLCITTSTRTQSFGASPGGNAFHIQIPTEHHIIGVYGGYGGHLHQLGVCYQYMGEFIEHHMQHAVAAPQMQQESQQQVQHVQQQPQPQPQQQQQQTQAQPHHPTPTIGPCQRKLQCGHACGGVMGESAEECFCWEEKCREGDNRSTQSASDPCLICLTDLSSSPCIRLTSCHHIFHHTCLYSMIIQGHNNITSRLKWNHLYCPLCTKHKLSHSSLSRVMKLANALYDDTVTLVTSLIQQHSLHQHTRVTNSTSPYYEKPLEFGMDHFAMYLCSKCHKPYCGGTRDCDRDMNQEDCHDSLICESCTESSDCKYPEHRSACLWKCRYCCSEAVYYCFGSIHVCKKCHDIEFDARRIGRARDQAQRAQCPPPGEKTCPLGLASDKHKNGITPDCELILRCMICSDPAAIQEAKRDSAVIRSPNLVTNPCGAQGLRSWRATRDWIVEVAQYEPPMSATHCFVNSFQWTNMVQTIDLYQCGQLLGAPQARATESFLSSLLDRNSPPPIEAFSYFCTRSDCGSVYELSVSLLSSSGRVLQSWSSGRRPGEACTWNRVGHVFTAYPRGVRAIQVQHGGQASKFWSGPYGPKCTATTVQVQFQT